MACVEAVTAAILGLRWINVNDGWGIHDEVWRLFWDEAYVGSVVRIGGMKFYSTTNDLPGARQFKTADEAKRAFERHLLEKLDE